MHTVRLFLTSLLCACELLHIFGFLTFYAILVAVQNITFLSTADRVLCTSYQRQAPNAAATVDVTLHVLHRYIKEKK